LRHVKFYQASTSELFGKVQQVPQNEKTPFYPRSPYGVSKLFGYWTIVNFREAYDIYASNGILFNHESPRRGKTFVTKKITRDVARIGLGQSKVLALGCLDAKRDWGYAPEYCEGMWRILQNDTADDFVLATGETHSVREFAEEAFSFVGIELEWSGEGVDEVGKITAIDTSVFEERVGSAPLHLSVGDTVVVVDPFTFVQLRSTFLSAIRRKAHAELGWKAKTTFKKLVELMVEADIHLALNPDLDK
jgi:GDPmannose 4,6-dehydratase